MGGPVLNGRRFRDEACTGFFPAFSTALLLEGDHRPSRGGDRQVTQTTYILAHDIHKTSISGTIPSAFIIPG